MSLTKKRFLTAVVAPVALAAFGLAAANDANADVGNIAYGYRKPDQVAALKYQVNEVEGMVPVAARFVGIPSVDGKRTEWLQDTIMMNRDTKEGLAWTKIGDSVCIGIKYKNIELYDNQTFDPSAALTVAGKETGKVDINIILTNIALKQSQFPMFRANATSPLNKVDHLPTEYIEYMVANPNTQSGAIFASTADGKYISNLTKAIPNPKEESLKFGAVYSDIGKSMLPSR